MVSVFAIEHFTIARRGFDSLCLLLNQRVIVFSNLKSLDTKRAVESLLSTDFCNSPFFGVLGMSILYRVKVPSLPASGKD